MSQHVESSHKDCVERMETLSKLKRLNKQTTNKSLRVWLNLTVFL